MEEILQMIITYGLETVVIALLVNILTGLVKMPIKTLANKLNDYTKVTRFIVFMPIGFGFLLSFLYAKYMVGIFSFNREFVTMWLTASSLSLTFYAIFEKIFPSKKKLLSDCEIKTSETILANIKQLIEEILPKESAEAQIEEKTVDNSEKKLGNKIVLRGKINAEAKVKK
jgi:Na+-translocating ferredoxin:NAD+ oxidoreductase RnfG subunit